MGICPCEGAGETAATRGGAEDGAAAGGGGETDAFPCLAVPHSAQNFSLPASE